MLISSLNTVATTHVAEINTECIRVFAKTNHVRQEVGRVTCLHRYFLSTMYVDECVRDVVGIADTLYGNLILDTVVKQMTTPTSAL